MANGNPNWEEECPIVTSGTNCHWMERAAWTAQRPPDRRGARRLDDQETGVKKFPQKISRNPLISLDSDEGIQGNPSFSNPLLTPFRLQEGGLAKTIQILRPGP